jgi:hypothetical protein
MGWENQTKRSDGLYIRKVDDDGSRWVIHTGRGVTVVRCPCCNLLLNSAHVARKVADAWFPPPNGTMPLDA